MNPNIKEPHHREGTEQHETTSAWPQSLMQQLPDFIPSDGSSADSVLLDAHLVRRIAEGDQQALVALYDRYSRPLYWVAIHLLNEARAAEEVLEEVFLCIWTNAHLFDKAVIDHFALAVIITRDQSLHRLNRCPELRQGLEVLPENGTQSAEDFGGDHSSQVRRLFDEMPPEQRQSIQLALFERLTLIQMAERLGEPCDTLQTRIATGMMLLRGGSHAGT